MPATIFSGSDVKALAKTLDLNGGAKILSSATDPTSFAVDAPKGSLLLNESSGTTYKKNDSGSSTDWTNIFSGASSFGSWLAYTPTITWLTNVTATGQYRIDTTKKIIQVSCKVLVNGSGSSGDLRITLPTGYDLDTSVFVYAFSGFCTVKNFVGFYYRSLGSMPVYAAWYSITELSLFVRQTATYGSVRALSWTYPATAQINDAVYINIQYQYL